MRDEQDAAYLTGEIAQSPYLIANLRRITPLLDAQGFTRCIHHDENGLYLVQFRSQQSHTMRIGHDNPLSADVKWQRSIHLMSTLKKAVGDLEIAVFHTEIDDCSRAVDLVYAEDRLTTCDGFENIERHETLSVFGFAADEDQRILGYQVFDEHRRRRSDFRQECPERTDFDGRHDDLPLALRQRRLHTDIMCPMPRTEDLHYFAQVDALCLFQCGVQFW